METGKYLDGNNEFNVNIPINTKLWTHLRELVFEDLGINDSTLIELDNESKINIV